MSKTIEKILLSEMLGQLREDLLVTQMEGRYKELKFEIQDIEIELQVVTTKAEGVNAGVNVWVLNADAKVDSSEAKTQKIKLKLKAVGRDEKPTKIADMDTLPD